MVVHNAYGYGLFTGGLGFHQGAERLGALVIPVSGGVTARQALLLRDLRGQVLCCTPSYALHIAQGLREAGHRPGRARAGDRACSAPSRGRRRCATQLEAELGLVALNIYGLSEIVGPGVACECPEARDGLHVHGGPLPRRGHRPRDAASRVPDGTDGELVFTTLTKEAMPLLRYRTGDIASLNREPCACGRTFARMSAVRGRRDDMLIVRGVNLYPSQIEHVLLGVDGRRAALPARRRAPGALDEITVQLRAGRGGATSTALARGMGARSASRSASASPSSVRARRDPAQRGQGRARDRPAGELDCPPMDWKLELVHDPGLRRRPRQGLLRRAGGFNADHDHQVNDELRFVQLTPPGSACSIAIGDRAHRRRPAPSRACSWWSPTSRPRAPSSSRAASRSARSRTSPGARSSSSATRTATAGRSSRPTRRQ